jgi:RNA polymerase sigma factor (sigma-70 family)
MDKFQELMARVREGDSEAAGELIKDYGPLLVKVVRRYLNPALRTQVDSADLVQEAWLSFLQSASKPNFESPQQFGAFLASIARNKVVDVVRRGLLSSGFNVTREVADAAEPTGDRATSHRDTPSKSAMRRELKDILLDELAPAYRPIGIRIFEGIEPSAIAEEYRVSQRTVERVRKRIVDQLQAL